MRKKQDAVRGFALWGLVAATTSVAVLAAKPPANLDATSDPTLLPNVPALKSRTIMPTSSGDEGSLAGTPVLIHDNGPMTTAPLAASCPLAGQGDLSLLENNHSSATPPGLCTGVLAFGHNATFGLSVADDFTISQCAKIEQVTIYGLTPNSSTTPTITAASVTLHSSRPATRASNVLATSSTILVPANFSAKIFRQGQSGNFPPGSCALSVQTVVLDTSSWPLLPAGTYWISWDATAGSMFCPQVTISGQAGKTGGNAMQALTAAGQYATLRDTGSTVAPCSAFPAPGVAQDMPFILEGDLPTCAPCVGDVTGDATVGVADLLNVIANWGPCAGCPADINGDNTVGVADLLTVIANWGACPPGPIVIPPPATGACTVGSVCSNGQTFDQCILAGGAYGGDGTVCSGACCIAGSCSVQSPASCASASGIFAGIGTTCPGGTCPPANDACASATPAAASQTFNNLFASADGPVVSLGTCASLDGNVTRDVWFTLATVNATNYTISTGTSAGGTSFDTTLEVLSNNCGTFTVEFCNDDLSGTDLRSTITFTGDGTTKLIRVGSWQNGAVGSITLTRSP